ncbi:GNAT family N-acetyltransferase [Campylobacter sp. RM16187]|uniref:GNAT family N-acetyltransferase n=1 Tax=Campylobacter sp. RM16187 TaxID=1660063 RepID=UPI0021B60749|nr:GNAT family N-acetyltransferase [Campylobacter sp. RM16187]QKG29297.1 acetyltransferase [Campylobacter sp. RM16187]
MENLVIIENSANFDPKDIDEIQLSIGWTEQKYIDAAPLYSHYDMFRSYDYVAIAKIGEKTIGVLHAFSDRDNFATSYLYGIMVHKDYQRKGVGRALMNAFNKRFAHTTTWVVTPISKNRDAVAFLEKFGFIENSKNFTICSRKRVPRININE